VWLQATHHPQHRHWRWHTQAAQPRGLQPTFGTEPLLLLLLLLPVSGPWLCVLAAVPALLPLPAAAAAAAADHHQPRDLVPGLQT
jgi:hypothetical protein